MWRTDAVVSMLVEDVAELRIEDSTEAASEDVEARPPELTTLNRARRRALLVGFIDWIAIAVLLAFHSGPDPFLPLGASTDAVFTLGVLAVATHAGFRLGQARTYKATARVCQDLWERQAD